MNDIKRFAIYAFDKEFMGHLNIEKFDVVEYDCNTIEDPINEAIKKAKRLSEDIIVETECIKEIIFNKCLEEGYLIDSLEWDNRRCELIAEDMAFKVFPIKNDNKSLDKNIKNFKTDPFHYLINYTIN